jgi:hypothetical protein
LAKLGAERTAVQLVEMWIHFGTTSHTCEASLADQMPTRELMLGVCLHAG